ncbi:MAG TPA: hypothetical protein VFV46_02890 [Lacibacter sp.]|nr:hypothetical protein [Lacibacter sp.]
MKYIFTLTLSLFSLITLAQVDTVVIRVDSMFESKFHRKLYDNRTNVKYHLTEWNNIREIAVYLATLEELNTGHKLYAVRIDQRLNRNIFTDAPMNNAEYIDEDELEKFIGYLKQVKNEIMKTDQNTQRYTEYRFYTRAGIMLECYTGINRWRCVIHYEIGKVPVDTYINNPERLEELIQTLSEIKKEIDFQRKKEN